MIGYETTGFFPFPVVIARGEINRTSATELEDALSSFDAEPVVVVMFEPCMFLDPGLLLGVLVRHEQRSPGRLIVVVPRESALRRIFDLTTLRGILTIVESMSQVLPETRPA
jgi:anti-anti-sigma regulatory factor